MTQVAVGDECTASSHHESYITTNHDVPWKVSFGEGDQFCVRFQNTTSTNVTVTTWVVDTEGGGDLSDTNFSTPVPANATVSVWFWEFGMKADQVSPRTEAELHINLRNDDGSEGVEIWHSIHH